MPSLRKMLKIGFTREQKRDTICSAIGQMRALEFYYHGGYRTVEPFALGIVIPGDDNESLICWQTGGFSELREVVGWKLYRESEMEDIVILKEEFNGERPNYDPDNIGMWQVLCCVRPRRKAPVVAETPEPLVETLPVVAEEPIPEPEPSPPIIRYFTHNELMERFRFAHPAPIPELTTKLWHDPLAAPYPAYLETESLPAEPNRYLVGQTA